MSNGPVRIQASGLFSLTASFTFMVTVAIAQYDAPAGYYNGTSGLSGTNLKNTLHNIIDDHTKLSYSNVWNALMEVDEDPNNPNNILTIYSNQSIPKSQRDGSTSASLKWNREHSWPKSYGFDTSSWPAYTDVHHLFASNATYNSTRGNCYFDEVSGGNSYVVYNVSGQYNYRSGNAWEPWDGVKGDMARAMFYMDVRYNGDKSNEPDLYLSETTTTTGEPRMAMLSELLQWHVQDPVDDRERRRNHLIYLNWQGNRNPFVDNPQFVCAVYSGGCGSSTPTPTPTPTVTPTTPPSGGGLSSGQQISGSVAYQAWQHYYIDLPGDVSQLSVELTANGSGDADLYVKKGSEPTTSSYDFRPYLSGSNETVTVTSSTSPSVSSGRWYISVRGYSAASYYLRATVSAGAAPTATPTPLPSPTPQPTFTPTPTVTPTPPPGGGALSSGQQITDSVAYQQWDFYYIDVPAGSSQLLIDMDANGSGDADVYVKKNSQPTLSSYDFRPWLNGSDENVTVNGSSSPALTSGRWYIGVYGYSAAGYKLRATISGAAPTATPSPSPTPSPTSSGSAQVLNVSSSVNQGAWKNYYVDVPSGKSLLQISMTGTGDGDLYVRKDAYATTSTWDFRPYLYGTNENVTVSTSTNPPLSSGRWWISVYGYEAATFTIIADLE